MCVCADPGHCGSQAVCKVSKAGEITLEFSQVCHFHVSVVGVILLLGEPDFRACCQQPITDNQLYTLSHKQSSLMMQMCLCVVCHTTVHCTLINNIYLFTNYMLLLQANLIIVTQISVSKHILLLYHLATQTADFLIFHDNHS